MKITNGKLIREIRKVNRCELGGCPCHGPCHLEVHHEPTWGSAGLETRLTVALICLYWHNKAHNDQRGHEVRQKIVAMICRREHCTEEEREAVVLLLKRAPKEADREWFQGQMQAWETMTVALLHKTLTEAGK